MQLRYRVNFLRGVAWRGCVIYNEGARTRDIMYYGGLMEQKYFYCRHCNTVVGLTSGSGTGLTCCGEKMQPLKAHNAYDEGAEKHLPVVERDGDELWVKVGKTEHPMNEAHHIEWIYVETLRGGIWHICLDQPTARFVPTGMPVAVYAYCNLHGLWKLNL